MKDEKDMLTTATEKDILDIIEDAWSAQYISLERKLNEALRRVRNLIVLEDYYRVGQGDENSLRRSFGSFGAGLFDIESMTTLLGKAKEDLCMSDERYEKIRKLAEDIESVIAEYEETPPQCEVVSSEKDLPAVFKKFDKHTNAMARVFKMLRIAKLEAKAAYDHEVHDPFFKKYNWRDLNSSELSLCPPFVVLVKPEEYRCNNELAFMLMSLITSGRAIKIVVSRTHFCPDLEDAGGAAALGCMIDIEMLPLIFRRVHIVQGLTVEGLDFSEAVSKALFSPKPSVISVFSPSISEDARLRRRAVKAVTSRAFPSFVYNPDKANDFVSCLSLGKNLENDSLWVESNIEYISSTGAHERVERPLTFADFALKEKEFEGHFTELPEDYNEDDLVLLADYILLAAYDRIHKTPFIYSVDEKSRLKQLVPSTEVVALTASRTHLWQTLQELAGIHNPHMQAAEKALREQFAVEKSRALAAQKAELEQERKDYEQAAVSSAMKNLAARLTGMSEQNVAMQVRTSTAAKATKAVKPKASKVEEEKPKAAPAKDLPWIETADCSSCDECVSINKKIFAYNKDRKAYIKDPKGGPYKDIVSAAESCPARIIHPGQPQDPNEKGLPQLIERAKEYQ